VERKNYYCVHLNCYVHLHLGDTHIDVFGKNPHIFNYPEVIVECTFFHQENGIHERANRDGHIHWDSLKPSITLLFIYLASSPFFFFLLLLSFYLI
jgi:hypothetical protein